MTLKKTDKLIAIIGVIILIIAGLGIILYAGGEKKDKDITPIEKDYTYTIICEEVTRQYPDETFSMKPKIIGQKQETKEFTLNQQNLKSVEIIVTYKDRSGLFPALGLLKRIGADTLTITFKDSQDNVIGKDGSKGDKTVNLPYNFGKTILTEPIVAKTEAEAQQILEERYIDYQETYEVSFSLKTGLIGRIRERFIGQHKITLTVNYTYYVYSLELVGSNGDDNMPPTGYQPGPSQGPYTATNQALTKH